MTTTEEPPDAPGEDYLTSGEVARLLQVHLATVYRWVDNGKLRCFRNARGARRFLRTDVLKFIEDSQVEALNETPPTEQPVSDRVVALLKYPMPATGLGKLIKGLERTYGKGLVIVTDGDDWRDGWMTVALPGEMSNGRVEDVDGVRQPVRLSAGDVRGEGVRHRSP